MSNVINLNFDDGIKELVINGDPNRTIRWNPSNVNFIDDFMLFQYWIENDFQEEMSRSRIGDVGEISKARVNDNGDLEVDGYEIGTIRGLGDQIASRLDLIFGEGTSEKAFCGANPMTPTPTGPIFVNFMTVLTPVIEGSLKDSEAAVGKYTNQSKNFKKSRGE